MRKLTISIEVIDDFTKQAMEELYEVLYDYGDNVSIVEDEE